MGLPCAGASKNLRSRLPPIQRDISVNAYCNRSDYDHAVVIVHTHSDDTRGDLFYTSTGGPNKGPLATTIDSVSLPFTVH